ncbi:MAG: ABC transporter permease [Acidobacteria bacterium]|nr:ABC transporter permease [Acidobacteriota bacterium]
MVQLLWSNLRARPMRTLLGIVAIGIQVFMVLFFVGLTAGIVSEWAKRVEGVGADILVQPPNASIFLVFSPAVMQESVADRIAKLSNVDEVAPVLAVMNSSTMDVVYGIDYQRFNALSKGFLFLQGKAFESPDEVIVDDIKAHTKGISVGDKVTLLGREFTVCGIVAHGKGARFFIPLQVAQEISGAVGRVSLFYVRSTGNTELARQEIVKLLPSDRVRSVGEYMTLMNSDNLPQFKPFIRAMLGIGVVISFLVVLLSMHTMVLERTKEIGILKSLGASRLDIIRLFIGETLLLTGFGIVLGLASTFALVAVLRETSPTLTVLITQDWILRTIALAIIGAVAGAVFPAFRAAGFDPVDALSYE